MKLTDPNNPRLSASDLVGHLACHHLTASKLAAARGEIEPPPWTNPVLEAIQERGREHEARFLEHLRARGVELLDLSGEGDRATGALRTEEAMRAGAAGIVQATLARDGWLGVADVLLRVEEPSALGAWSYEVYDTKLARETSGGTILQLCFYSELVREIQREWPRRMHVVPPGTDFESNSYRVFDYLAYYRLAKTRLGSFVRAELDGTGEATYPDPTHHCEVCRWWPVCDRRRHDDDHLCLVAGISSTQIKELRARGIERLETLAREPIPLEWKPDRGSAESYERAREQARVQLRTRDEKKTAFELLPREEKRGLTRLPEPSSQDVFFDIEGDSFAEDGGREYLFGYAFTDDGGVVEYESAWALEAGDERRMFERFVAEMMRRWTIDPGFHIYHYAPYEPTALKRLMGRYATCENEIDRMLRAGVFVDLYSVARQSILAGVESYSIKKLEPLFDFEREEDPRAVRADLSTVERALELGEADSVPKSVLEAVETYNRDDCVATLRLRAWLEGLRAELVDGGESISRPDPESGDPSEKLTKQDLANRELAARLLRDVPEDREAWSREHLVRWRLANLLGWHWREEKVVWWEYFRLAEMDAEELLDERAGIAGLRFEDAIGGTRQCPIHRYSYPLQEISLKEDDKLHEGKDKVGTVVAIDQVARSLDVKRTGKTAHRHPAAVFTHKRIGSGTLAGSLFRLGEWVATNGLNGDGHYRAARDLLQAKPPRFRPGATGLEARSGEETLERAERLALELDHGTLPVQGPPGSGKTFSGARMICSLVAAGKKVGITANSHKVIRNLLDEVVRAARERGESFPCVQRVRDLAEGPPEGITETLDNAEVLGALEGGDAPVGAGTAWLWAREEFFESVDVLFVDEAGQMSLANALAVAPAGKSLVLLGDPQQLEQPLKGSHPEGTDVSALEHILGDRDTIPDDCGLFLPETWRLHPSICEFTSEVFYEDRLESRAGMELQRLDGTEPIGGAGLWLLPVSHTGNQSSCPEEVEAVSALVERLTAPGASWTDKDGNQRPLGLGDILVIAPYNAQVALLSQSLGPEARVGTVDKFQGQQAPVVIYSMTTSSAEEAPRGMEFLYSLNRLNVATSRARCACVLVGSPLLSEPECRKPRQMELANALCRYLEMAELVS